MTRLLSLVLFALAVSFWLAPWLADDIGRLALADLRNELRAYLPLESAPHTKPDLLNP